MKQILRKAIALILAVTAVLFPLAQTATLIRTTDSYFGYRKNSCVQYKQCCY